MIGQDFPKIAFDFAGLALLEPNAMIGDIVLFTTSLFFAAQIRKINQTHPFYQNWRLFFLWFGWSFLFGGIGHLFYNYLHLWGKYPSWIFGMVATFFLTKGMLSLWPNDTQRKQFLGAAKILLILGIVVEVFVFYRIDLTIDQSKGLFVPTLISGIGLIFSLVVLGLRYQKLYQPQFKFFWIAALILLPNAFIQSQKINIHQWFDRNDFSHVLLLVSLCLYYFTIKATRNAAVFVREQV
ncbi:MAG: hypothetical protein NWS31_02630 [Crocinitomicaceae bacterium]|jgi:hypothetical protein|nr:hypothetical protein [Crocinitomicaceae bacterium]MDP4740059.1 hypothetical protein [Crocinitomicaceae bacterium]MDP4799875.1 hypothetical protein [Crocinitomicaceae bacterium]MDP4807384.1 hypothetical protein [Crocinitomicaceae bacterium]MDP4868778.1 hypothetical protein [Crocinitomicaceae bacterium]